MIIIFSVTSAWYSPLNREKIKTKVSEQLRTTQRLTQRHMRKRRSSKINENGLKEYLALMNSKSNCLIQVSLVFSYHFTNNESVELRKHSTQDEKYEIINKIKNSKLKLNSIYGNDTCNSSLFHCY